MSNMCRKATRSGMRVKYGSSARMGNAWREMRKRESEQDAVRKREAGKARAATLRNEAEQAAKAASAALMAKITRRKSRLPETTEVSD